MAGSERGGPRGEESNPLPFPAAYAHLSSQRRQCQSAAPGLGGLFQHCLRGFIFSRLTYNITYEVLGPLKWPITYVIGRCEDFYDFIGFLWAYGGLTSHFGSGIGLSPACLGLIFPPF